MIEEAIEDVGALHGTVFPEYALDWQTYEALAEAIAAEFPSLKFMVSSSSSNCRDERANLTLSSVFARGANELSDKPFIISTSRTKHHRWRLDEAQVSSYVLASSLDPRFTWWDKTLLPEREIHVSVFREGSTFATMICEDLARAEPCHTVLRSVGPSLVLVVLMDGLQLAGRWSSRYATVLADDPGSSVLTLTSLGLLERANRTGRKDASLRRPLERGHRDHCQDPMPSRRPWDRPHALRLSDDRSHDGRASEPG